MKNVFIYLSALAFSSFTLAQELKFSQKPKLIYDYTYKEAVLFLNDSVVLKTKKKEEVSIYKSAFPGNFSALSQGDIRRLVNTLEDIKKWACMKWNPCGTLEIAVMPNRFILFSFSLKEDFTRALLGGPWFFGRRGFYIRKWSPGFNSLTETIT